MEEISKYCKTLKQAERKQAELYSKFPYVRLISSPTWTEEGVYTWNVSL